MGYRCFYLGQSQIKSFEHASSGQRISASDDADSMESAIALLRRDVVAGLVKWDFLIRIDKIVEKLAPEMLLPLIQILIRISQYSPQNCQEIYSKVKLMLFIESKVLSMPWPNLNPQHLELVANTIFLFQILAKSSKKICIKMIDNQICNVLAKFMTSFEYTSKTNRVVTECWCLWTVFFAYGIGYVDL